MAFVFHVEFGMNDTPLTQALEQGNYATAERLILDCPNASYLDDGMYQRIPLFICLCGVDDYHQKVMTRNLHLARLLIEHGANVNHRVPVTNFGSEYLSPGKSALELLVDFYIDLTRQPVSGHAELPWHPYQKQWNPMTELVVGLNRQYLTSVKDVQEDIRDLIFNILRHGGDPSLLDEHRMTPVHRVSMLCQDVSLLHLLCDNGASLQAVDSLGNTPLLSLCSVTSLDSDDGRLSPVSDSDILEAAGGVGKQEDLRVKMDFLHFLLKREDTDVNHQNNAGQTALLHTILREDIQASKALLEVGADPGLQGYMWESRRKRRKLSPLFASFSSIPMQQSMLGSNLYTQVTQVPQFIAPLVDAGYFTTREVIQEISSLIESDFSEFSHLRSSSDSLIHLMFGYKSASLKQLAARKIFQCCLMESTASLMKILPVSSIQDNYQVAQDVLSDPRRFEEYVTLILNCTVLRRLSELLCIPRSLLIYLEVQLLYLRMALKFHNLQAQRPLHNYVQLQFSTGDRSDQSSDSNDEDSDSSSGSSYSTSSGGDVEGDSDLEYW